MFRHNLLLAYRNFLRYKSTFFINLIGLSTGLACALLIYLWVNDELRVDKFHEKDSQLYQVMHIVQTPNSIQSFEGTPGLLARSLAEEIPEVVSAVAVRPSFNHKGILSIEDKHIKASEQYVGKEFFNIFSYQLIQGDKYQVLTDKYSVVISDELARKLFNTIENVIGKTVEWNHDDLSGSYLISGIFERPPSNSSAQFDILFNYELFLEKRSNFLSWENSNPATYIILKEGTNVDQFNEKIAGFIKTKLPTSNSTLFLRQYSDKYLYGQYENGIQAGGRIEYVRLFSIVAIIILTIACINFMNLSTAKASRRLKEVGVKKAIGADRKTLIIQFLSESMMMAFLSLLLSLILVVLVLPQFNNITGKHLTFAFGLNIILSVLGITSFTGFISGSYPAFYLSGFRPATILKGGGAPGKLNTSTAALWMRKGLVVFQFTISVIFIASVLVVSKQLSFIQNKNLGYDRDNVIYFTNEGKVLESFETFLSEVKHIPGVVNASSFANNLTGSHGGTSGVNWEAKNPDEAIDFGNLEVGYDFIETLGIEMAAGRTFSREFGADSSSIIFNEAAIESMGLQDPIGKTIKLWGQEKRIIGVVKNFHFESLYEEIKPCFLQLYPVSNKTMVKIQEGSEAETLAQLQQFYQEYNQGLPLDYKFLDDDYQVLYASEQRVTVLSRYFAGLAILISCLGLFGLAAFTAERRLKEIGIRKVLGSTDWGIAYLLSNDFTKMVVTAIVIALPLSYFIAKNWLESFAYRIDLELWYFIGAGLVALLIAWFTVGLQTVKAAKVNPTQCLKDE